MAHTIYSTQFLDATTTFGGTSFASYTVPAGYVAIVTHWTVAKLATAATRAYLTVGPATTSLVAVVDLPVVAISSGGLLGAHIVAQAGSIVRVDCVTGGSVRQTVNGYLLLM